MTLDNIQKSILAVLGISGMAAFLTPTSLPKADNSQNAQVGAEGQVMPPAPPPKLVAPPPPVADTSSATQAPMPAFGEPTISGLPYGQAPRQKNQDGDDSSNQTTNNSASEPESVATMVEGTVLPSGGVVKNGEVVF